MNRNQVRGSAKQAAGKVQADIGKVFGSARQQSKGLAKQVEGKVQKSYGDAEEAIEETNDKRRDKN
jgi:uncharacterized protein YjbJ (UPF0337 family)